MRSTARVYAYGENQELFDKIKFRRKLTRPERLLIERQFPGALRE